MLPRSLPLPLPLPLPPRNGKACEGCQKQKEMVNLLETELAEVKNKLKTAVEDFDNLKENYGHAIIELDEMIGEKIKKIKSLVRDRMEVKEESFIPSQKKDSPLQGDRISSRSLQKYFSRISARSLQQFFSKISASKGEEESKMENEKSKSKSKHNKEKRGKKPKPSTSDEKTKPFEATVNRDIESHWNYSDKCSSS